MEVAILKQRLAYNHLPNAFEPLNIPEPISVSTITNPDIRQNLSERYHKILQRTKSDMMCVYIAAEEAKAEEHRIKFDKDMASTNASLRSSGPANRQLTRTMVDLLLKRFKNTEERYFQIQNRLFTISLSRCSSQSIYGTTSLSRSRTYLCITGSTTSCVFAGITTRSNSSQANSTIKATANTLIYHVSRRSARRMNFEKDVQLLFQECFSSLVSIPPSVVSRASYEKQLIGSIRQHLRREGLVLRRTADDCNTFYLGRYGRFRQQASEYLEESLCYEIIELISETNTLQQQLASVAQSIDSALTALYGKILIKQEHFSKLSAGRKRNLQLLSVYFLPDMHEVRPFLCGFLRKRHLLHRFV
jgi:hypothetical protein